MLLLSPDPGPLGKRQRREQPGCYTLNGLGVSSTPAVTTSTPPGKVLCSLTPGFEPSMGAPTLRQWKLRALW